MVTEHLVFLGFQKHLVVLGFQNIHLKQTLVSTAVGLRVGGPLPCTSSSLAGRGDAHLVAEAPTVWRVGDERGLWPAGRTLVGDVRSKETENASWRVFHLDEAGWQA